MTPEKQRQVDLVVEYYDLRDQIAFLTPPHYSSEPVKKQVDSPKIRKLRERIEALQEEELKMVEAGTWTPTRYTSFGPYIPIPW